MRTTKRRKVTSLQVRPEIISLHNKYSALELNTKEPASVEVPQIPAIPKPPPIFVYGITNFPDMVRSLRNIVDDDQYTTKCMADNTVKINSTTPETYRTLIRHMRDNNIIHHTYQPKEERAYRIVLKHVHHSVHINDIKRELEGKGHAVRNIMNGRHWKTKEPLNLFFIDLAPAENNTEVFKIQRLLNLAVVIETPKRYKGIIQCTRCQQYGHSKTYCNKPFVCVKCGGRHNTAECRKPPLRRQRPTYADITKGKHTAEMDENSPQSCTLSTFLAEFKLMFNQLLQQNSMILNMLTMLINKK